MQEGAQVPETDEHDGPEELSRLTPDGHPHNGDEGLTSTVLVEVAPGVVAAYGSLQPELGLEPLDLTLIPGTDREAISNALATLGNSATVAGNLATAASGAQGLFRLADVSMAKLAAGGTLAAKDGAYLGTILMPSGGGLAQARFVPVTAAGVGTLAASAGPALAMIALQASLNHLNDLVRTNIALTNQVLNEGRQQSWSELTGLTKEIEKATERARLAGAVTDNMWSAVAGKGADLETQRDRYRRKVKDHVRALEKRQGHAQREYLESNSETIAFDSYALLSSLKAWIGYQALFATRERAAGAADSPEARVAEAILNETRKELGPALDEITELVSALSRELQLVVELPGRSALPGTKRRKDTKTARRASSRLLEAIAPLTEQLLLPLPDLERPDVLCIPENAQLERYLTVLRLLLEHGESLRAIGLPYQVEDGEVGNDLVQAVLGGPLGEELARRAGRNPDRGTTIVAVTDRRILTARAASFLRTGELGRETAIGDVRYVRRRSNLESEERDRIDLVTKETNIRWDFHSTTDATQVDALAALLAESMTLPESERIALTDKRLTLTIGAENEATEAGDAVAPPPERGSVSSPTP